MDKHYSNLLSALNSNAESQSRYKQMIHAMSRLIDDFPNAAKDNEIADFPLIVSNIVIHDFGEGINYKPLVAFLSKIIEKMAHVTNSVLLTTKLFAELHTKFKTVGYHFAKHNIIILFHELLDRNRLEYKQSHMDIIQLCVVFGLSSGINEELLDIGLLKLLARIVPHSQMTFDDIKLLLGLIKRRETRLLTDNNFAEPGFRAIRGLFNKKIFIGDFLANEAFQLCEQVILKEINSSTKYGGDR